jgi:chromosome condensin MukBEF MukE localization factor
MRKRNCTDEEHEGPRYLTVDKFHKKGVRNGRQFYDEKCKKCRNRRLRKLYAEEKRSGGWDPDKKRAYSRARSRALTRLAKLVPELYDHVLQEELSKEPVFAKKT